MYILEGCTHAYIHYYKYTYIAYIHQHIRRQTSDLIKTMDALT